MLNKITNVCTVTLTILACSFATAQSTQWTGWQSAKSIVDRNNIPSVKFRYRQVSHSVGTVMYKYEVKNTGPTAKIKGLIPYINQANSTEQEMFSKTIGTGNTVTAGQFFLGPAGQQLTFYVSYSRRVITDYNGSSNTNAPNHQNVALPPGHVRGGPGQPATFWSPGTKHPTIKNIFAGDTEGSWQPAPGYDWVNSVANDLSVRAIPASSSSQGQFSDVSAVGTDVFQTLWYRNVEQKTHFVRIHFKSKNGTKLDYVATTSFTPDATGLYKGFPSFNRDRLNTSARALGPGYHHIQWWLVFDDGQTVITRSQVAGTVAVDLRGMQGIADAGRPTTRSKKYKKLESYGGGTAYKLYLDGRAESTDYWDNRMMGTWSLKNGHLSVSLSKRNKKSVTFKFNGVQKEGGSMWFRGVLKDRWGKTTDNAHYKLSSQIKED